MAHHDEHSHDDGAVHVHIHHWKLYMAIFVALIFFTVVTIALSYFHLGPFNLAVAILIATMKAALVLLFFMHLKDDEKFNSLFFVGSLAFVAVFFAYTMNDTERRREVDPAMHAYIDPVSGETAPGGTDRVKLRDELRYGLEEPTVGPLSPEGARRANEAVPAEPSH